MQVISPELPVRRAALLTLLAVISTGCFHATINTGRTPGSTTIEKPWAMSHIAGLVPPAMVETASKCPSGIAMVETQMSLPNYLVGAITFGIVTPMSIKVTCAASGRSEAPAIRSQGDAIKAISEAADRARETGAPVFVQF